MFFKINASERNFADFGFLFSYSIKTGHSIFVVISIILNEIALTLNISICDIYDAFVE